MSAAPADRRRDRAPTTRSLLLHTAERLYAERGLAAVSMRQILEAAGVANNSALAYHIGTRADLIRAIVEPHVADIVRHTRPMVQAAVDSTDPRQHVACLVQPYLRHLAELGTPSWWARFTAQISTDPAFGDPMHEHPELARLLAEAGGRVWAYAPDLPPQDVALRTRVIRLAVLHTCAEQEAGEAAADWEEIGSALTDAITGLVLAPHGRSLSAEWPAR
jgi:AcrR family transcriptional regulator